MKQTEMQEEVLMCDLEEPATLAPSHLLPSSSMATMSSSWTACTIPLKSHLIALSFSAAGDHPSTRSTSPTKKP
jgi:hypothetical protein